MHTERKIGADFRCQKMESIYGAGFWFLERVSWALEAPQTVDRIDCSFVHGTVKSTNIDSVALTTSSAKLSIHYIHFTACCIRNTHGDN